jgi:16S rRNA processing protein RimM
VGRELFVEREQLRLAPDEYLDADLTGLRLIDLRGNELGTVVGVEHYATQDCLIVGPQRALVPMVRAFIHRIDVAAGTIAVDLPDGLLS